MLIRRWILARHRSETTVFVTACDRGPCPQPCHAPTASPIRHRFRTLRTLGVRESKDLRDLFVTQFWTPMEVKQVMGYALYLAQTGSKHPDAKPLAGFGSAGVVEVVDDFVRSTYRAVYTVRLQGVVLRAPCLPEEVEEGEQDATRRDRIGEAAAAARLGDSRGARREAERRVQVKRKFAHREGSGNVFKDLDPHSPEETLAKAELTAKIAEIIASARLTQAEAAKILGADQPKVSALLRGHLSGFSTERLFKFLTSLGRDVEIVVRMRRSSRGRGHLHVVSA